MMVARRNDDDNNDSLDDGNDDGNADDNDDDSDGDEPSAIDINNNQSSRVNQLLPVFLCCHLTTKLLQSGFINSFQHEEFEG